MGRTRVLVVLLVCLAGLVLAAVALAAPPSNDDRVNAAPLDLPASVRGTTVDATIEESEPPGSCDSIRNSVWYSVPAGAERRVAVRLAAAGDLDAVVEVFKRVRSQLELTGCERTDRDGDAALSFRAEEDERYLIRVSQRFTSVPGSFQLDVFSPQPPARPPGAPLPRGGVTRAVDRLENTDEAFSARLRSGVSYRVNLGPRGERCIGLSLFGPGTTDFEDGSALRSLRCGGYFLFTPGPDAGGRYSLLVQSNDNKPGPQRYHLQVARAGPDDTIPGLRLRGLTRGSLRGGQVDAVDLYRFDILRRSNVDLRLNTRGDDDFDLQLLRQGGRPLECACGTEGDEQIDRRLRRGRYYVAVRTAPGNAGRYGLRRVVRTITATRVRFDGRRKNRASPGRAVAISARVRPAVSGPVTIVVERLDPLFGFQFARRYRTRARAGRATVLFRPRAVGRYRASAAFTGTRSAAPSESGFAGLIVAGSLRR